MGTAWGHMGTLGPFGAVGSRTANPTALGPMGPMGPWHFNAVIYCARVTIKRWHRGGSVTATPGDTSGVLWGHFGGTLGTLWGCCGDTLGTLGGPPPPQDPFFPQTEPRWGHCEDIIYCHHVGGDTLGAVGDTLGTLGSSSPFPPSLPPPKDSFFPQTEPRWGHCEDIIYCHSVGGGGTLWGQLGTLWGRFGGALGALRR